MGERKPSRKPIWGILAERGSASLACRSSRLPVRPVWYGTVPDLCSSTVGLDGRLPASHTIGIVPCSGRGGHQISENMVLVSVEAFVGSVEIISDFYSTPGATCYAPFPYVSIVLLGVACFQRCCELLSRHPQIRILGYAGRAPAVPVIIGWKALNNRSSPTRLHTPLSFCIQFRDFCGRNIGYSVV